jgi:hypothetical protein
MSLYTTTRFRLTAWITSALRASFSALRRPCATLVAVLLAAGAAGAPTVQAQSPAPGLQAAGPPSLLENEPWTQNVGAQLARTLRQASPAHRADAMQTLIQLKYRYGAAVDVSECVPLLLKLATRDDAETGPRMLAITALYRTGNEAALRTLVKRIEDDPSAPVRQHAKRLLAAFRVAQP